MKASLLSIEKSMSLWKRATSRIPCGTQCYSKGPTAYTRGSSPIYLNRGDGCRVWDVDGNEFVDLGMGLWAVTLGHNYPSHTEAIIQAQRQGTQLSLMHPLEVELAEVFSEVIPVAEMVRYGKNGSDVTTAAVRLARTCTGRDVILRSGYHGWHDWYIAHSEHSDGVPIFNREITGRFDEHDIKAFDNLMDRHSGNVAGVIMEGIQSKEIDPEFLAHVRKRTRETGALLIFDEVINGYRFAVGGAHEYLKIDVDLATFGKAMANGTPMALLCGKKIYMEKLNDTFFSLTFGGETLGLAAALEVLKVYREENVIQKLHQTGAYLHAQSMEAIQREGLEEFISLSPHPVRTVWNFHSPYADCDALVLKSLFQQEVIKRGILWGGWHSLSLALANDADAQNRIIEGYNEAIEIIRKAITSHTVREMLSGEPIAPIFKRH